ncbi:hypothetical protein HMPREF9440_01296 [Sutterella parvirubra YIT 11816]|uniref:Uncharacterized protein n=1 Tax=Sutterella parvirubra YIT 11816 TaxID=762967 RepID=H3KEY1_9BURK|nr:hypothetical protein HMPREF9440_01296 [Sutterella parvirubra YIT 11816]
MTGLPEIIRLAAGAEALGRQVARQSGGAAARRTETQTQVPDAAKGRHIRPPLLVRILLRILLRIRP